MSTNQSRLRFHVWMPVFDAVEPCMTDINGWVFGRIIGNSPLIASAHSLFPSGFLYRLRTHSAPISNYLTKSKALQHWSTIIFMILITREVKGKQFEIVFSGGQEKGKDERDTKKKCEDRASTSRPLPTWNNYAHWTCCLTVLLTSYSQV